MMIQEWIGQNGIKTMNVAGPRESKDPMLYQAVLKLLEEMKRVRASFMPSAS